MFSQTRIKKLINQVRTSGLAAGLTNEQVAFVKTKITALETLTNAAQAKFTTIESRLAAIEARLTKHGI